MRCRYCGSDAVEWRGPLAMLSHTQCMKCGAINAQDVEEQEEDLDEMTMEEQLNERIALLGYSEAFAGPVESVVARVHNICGLEVAELYDDHIRVVADANDTLEHLNGAAHHNTLSEGDAPSWAMSEQQAERSLTTGWVVAANEPCVSFRLRDGYLLVLVCDPLASETDGATVDDAIIKAFDGTFDATLQQHDLPWEWEATEDGGVMAQLFHASELCERMPDKDSK